MSGIHEILTVNFGFWNDKFSNLLADSEVLLTTPQTARPFWKPKQSWFPPGVFGVL